MTYLVNLEELFPIKIGGISSSRYQIEATYDLVQRPLIVEREEFEAYANSLKQKHNEIKVYERKIKGKNYIIVQGRLNGKRTSSLYYSIEDKKVYMPLSFLKKKQKLSVYIIWRALGSMKKLKQLERKTIGVVEKEEGEAKHGD
jgi:hypothetical protein